MPLTEDEIRQIKKDAEAQLMALPNVTGVGVGVNLVGGRPTGEIAIVVTVAKKVPQSQLGSEDVVPAQIQGVPTDVIVVGPSSELHEPSGPEVPDLSTQRILWDGGTDRRDRAGKDDQAPLLGGVTLRYKNRYSGTLGCIVRTLPINQRGITSPELTNLNFNNLDHEVGAGFSNANVPGGQIVGLTNHHVANSGTLVSEEVGTLDIQGGPWDLETFTGSSFTSISERVLWQRNLLFIQDGQHWPLVDAAILELEAGIEYYTDVLDVAGPVADPTDAFLPDPSSPCALNATNIAAGTYWVCKRGARTGYTEGIVHCIDYTATVSDPPGTYTDAILVRPAYGHIAFGWRGDSGSVCLNAFNQPIGLLARGAIFQGLTYVSVPEKVNQKNAPGNSTSWGILCRMDLVMEVMGIEILFDTRRSQKKVV